MTDTSLTRETRHGGKGGCLFGVKARSATMSGPPLNAERRAQCDMGEDVGAPSACGFWRPS
jgi:hypothetical protein